MKRIKDETLNTIAEPIIKSSYTADLIKLHVLIYQTLDLRQ